MSQCEQVSEAGLHYLRQKCLRLRYVNLKDCYNVVGDVGWESEEEEEWQTEEEEENE